MYNKVMTGDIGGIGYNITEPHKIQFYLSMSSYISVFLLEVTLVQDAVCFLLP